MNKNFAIVGVGGYIAPRHLKAIKDTNNNLIAALDKFDSVGIMDSYFPEAHFFVEFERFDRHIEKIKRRKNIALDYVSICTPNYLHDSHIRMALRRGAHAICEKPIVINPWNVDQLIEIENESEHNVYSILQLRIHESIIALKKKVDQGPKDKIYDIDLTYLTSRGNWYYTSWKGDVSKSGGIATNIGVHFYDMLSWIFGKVTKNVVHKLTDDTAAGYLEFEKARVRWFLSIDYNNIPEKVKKEGKRTYRSITVNGEEIEFSGGFTELHTNSYKSILNGNGYGLKDARQSIEIVHDIRNASISELKNDYHPFLKSTKDGLLKSNV
ncbi:UDP-N-acetyl-2-amino-2-deoxyglucuronate dehydrogenase [Aquimarina amphilecti]|uniref:UDP-N-acetyl-2-amino-2-deoxyglucuronate dehydrogenase n=1 Tax=Aquimarina amphilecti TaxID=1038014 RepID=A0A1H7MJB1_AQUAM|nr:MULTISPECIES: Gfo/Idh/MocA family oxidoreductase [Aquimarina]AXT58112.1 gfo/Idh/MocA family oxidoreductase [Aquimarina sp. AD1]MBQ4802999.1 Gfo/Idh/MocA family oxidoreductase [Aquimarina sp. MMG015]RKN26109.1 gfo/Idh/MocA family oxidoreductase [Aquimarina sp. AD1]SEL10988.1 UDP-N-acetyl-2-amino-2-deoxyglucuronate dehydrogenase [Aquimarina amphilecti]